MARLPLRLLSAPSARRPRRPLFDSSREVPVMKRSRLHATGVAVAAAALVLTGCQTASSQNAGGGGGGDDAASSESQPEPTVENVADLKIAYFSAGSSNQYL